MDKKKEVTESKILTLLLCHETEDIEPPYKCLSPIDREIAELKAKRIYEEISNKLIEPLDENELRQLISDVLTQKTEFFINFEAAEGDFIIRELAKALTGKVGRRQVGREEIKNILFYLVNSQKVACSDSCSAKEGLEIASIEKATDAILSLVNEKE